MPGEARPRRAGGDGGPTGGIVRHAGWQLPHGGEAERRIIEQLALGRAIPEVAESVGVAEGYARAIATESDDAPAPHETKPVTKPPAESPFALSRVHCMVAGAEIGARECIQRQCDDKCFCPKASFAINAIAPTVLPGTRLEDQLARCKAVARWVLLKPDAEDRHLGPALVALRGGAPVPRPLIAGELPAVPAPAVRRAPVPATAPVSRETAPQPAAPAAPKERSMPRISPLATVSDDDFRKAFDEAGGSVNAIRKKFGSGFKVVNARVEKLGLRSVAAKPAAPATKKPAASRKHLRVLDDVADKHVERSAEEFLQDRLARLRERIAPLERLKQEAQRIEVALQAFIE